MLQSNSKPGLEIRFEPDGFVHVYENHGTGGVGRDLFTAVIQNIAFVNVSNEIITIHQADLQVIKDGTVTQSHTIVQDELKKAALQFHTYHKQGILDAYDFQFRTSRYLKDLVFAQDTILKPRETLVVTRNTLLFHGLPDGVLTSVKGHNTRGDAIITDKQLRVVNHTSKNTYDFPVKGRWMIAGAPSLHSHHRWGTLEEFTLDLAKIGADGLTHSDGGTMLPEFYSWGAPINAMAEGTVVSVRGDMEESDTNLQQPGESAESYFQRMMSMQQDLIAKGFDYTLGNHVVIQHAHNECSRYVHLQHNSVCVKVGDRVVRGQHIANLGHSGNSTEPHLHFDLADGPDFAYSRSIPLSFENITLYPDDDGSVRHLHLGQIVITQE